MHEYIKTVLLEDIKQLYTVTLVSKITATIVCISLPFVGAMIGYSYALNDLAVLKPQMSTMNTTEKKSANVLPQESDTLTPIDQIIIKNSDGSFKKLWGIISSDSFLIQVSWEEFCRYAIHRMLCKRHITQIFV